MGSIECNSTNGLLCPENTCGFRRRGIVPLAVTVTFTANLRSVLWSCDFHCNLYYLACLLPELPLQWRQNGHDGLSNHQPHHCLLSPFIQAWSKKISKLCVTGLCAVTGEFPAQVASNAENVSIWWRHHVNCILLHVSYRMYKDKFRSNSDRTCNICRDLLCEEVVTLALQFCRTSWVQSHDDRSEMFLRHVSENNWSIIWLRHPRNKTTAGKQ